jgi:hypothetical protein
MRPADQWIRHVKLTAIWRPYHPLRQAHPAVADGLKIPFRIPTGENSMYSMRFVVLATAMLASISAFAANEARQADKQAVDQACMAEAQAASCGSDQAGTGLVKCIHAYKKANPGFKVSPGCGEALKTLHQENKTLRAEKQPAQ